MLTAISLFKNFKRCIRISFFKHILLYLLLSEARKNKGGLGYVLLMAGMLAKTLGALGFGGVTLLALKALGASLAALLLSSIVGLKKLGEQGHHENHVQYVTADHHRKKRNII